MTTPLHTLYTLGYTGAKPDHILKFLIAHNAKLIDTRYSPFSRAPMWQKRALMSSIGNRYVHMAELGNKNYKGQFGEGIMIADMDRGTLDLLKILKGQPAVLLCACPDYHTCHRTTVADEMADRYGVTVVHLELADLTNKPTPPAPPPQLTLF